MKKVRFTSLTLAAAIQFVRRSESSPLAAHRGAARPTPSPKSRLPAAAPSPSAPPAPTRLGTSLPPRLPAAGCSGVPAPTPSGLHPRLGASAAPRVRAVPGCLAASPAPCSGVGAAGSPLSGSPQRRCGLRYSHPSSLCPLPSPSIPWSLSNLNYRITHSLQQKLGKGRQPPAQAPWSNNQALAEKGKERHKEEVREVVFFGCCIGLET